MTTIQLLLVAIGGFFGACSRYGFSQWVAKRFPSVLPRATLIINLSGSFLLGLFAGADGGTTVHLLLGVGFMGAFTTFSTFNVENITLARAGAWKVLICYMGASYGLGLMLAYAGYELGMMLAQ